MGRQINKLHDPLADTADQWIFTTEHRLPLLPGPGRIDGGGRFQEFVSNRFVLGLYPACHEAIMPDHVEVLRRDVADEFSDELDGFQRVDALTGVVTVVFEFEGEHFPEQPLIRISDMGGLRAYRPMYPTVGMRSFRSSERWTKKPFWYSFFMSSKKACRAPGSENGKRSGSGDLEQRSRSIHSFKCLMSRA